MEFSYATTRSEADWNQWALRNIEVGNGGISLSRTTTVKESTIGDNIRDIALDSTGNLYTLSTSGGIARYDSNTESRRLLWDANTSPSADPSAIGASDNQIFFADQKGAIKKISLDDSRVTDEFQSPATNPHDLAYNRGRIYAIDEGRGIVTFGGQKPGLDWPLQSPVDMAVTEESVYALSVVDEDIVVRVDHDIQQREHEPPLIGSDEFRVKGEGFRPTAIAAPGETLILAGAYKNRDELGLFEWNREADDFDKFSQLPGTCDKLIGRKDRDGLRTLYAIGGPDNTCQVLAETTETIRHPEQDSHVGLAVTQYDAGVEGIEWHRVAFERARSSANTQVRLWYRTADDPRLITTNSIDKIDSLWELTKTDPQELAAREEKISETEVRFLRSKVFDVLEDDIESNWTRVSDTASQDILLRNATGRYLTIALELIGTRTTSPLIDSVTAYCPRQSYLRYMPELYQNEQESAEFLERFLSVFETSFVDIQSEIEDMTQYLDPSGIPSESLGWLEGWLAADEYSDWPESARREYLARAPELYKKRGTQAGIREIIELYLRHATDGVSPSTTKGDQIPTDTGPDSDTESGHMLFFLDRSDIESVTSEALETLVPNDRSFVVYCGPFESDAHEEAIETIVETEKPAHVESTVYTLDDEFVLSKDTLLGINAKLGTQSFSLGEGVLGKDTYLTD